MPRTSSFFQTPAYGWVIVVLAACAMIATLPGRTHGLGMITERLLADSTLQLDRQSFGHINFCATLIGAFFCLPVGWMLDRCGLRVTSTVIAGLLGIVVIAMTNAVGLVQFALLITLTRGLGQSALSVVSISMTGKWFRDQLPLATGIYSLLVSIGFAAAFVWGRGQSDLAWRIQWSWLGYLLFFVLTPVFAILVRSPSTTLDESSIDNRDNQADFTLTEALKTPAFWMFGIATSLYGLVSSGVSLFNESLLVERGFEKTAFYDLGTMTTAIGLISNLATGWVTTKIKITTVAATAMGLLAVALLGLPFVSSRPALVTYAVAMGCAGGMVTVLFFTIWAQLFGRTQLGKIQGIAQMLTVFASALGPVILAEVKVRTGSYLPAIVSLGFTAAVLAVAIAVVPIPTREPEASSNTNLELATSS
jgi:MFS family permease